MKTVGLAFDISQGYQRDVAGGALKFLQASRLSKPLIMGGQVVHPLARIPLLEAQGLIGHLYPGYDHNITNRIEAAITTANVEPEDFLSSVCSDDRAVGRMGAEYLAGLGYRRLAFAGSETQLAVKERRLGFIAAGEQLNCEIAPGFEEVFKGKIMINWDTVRSRILKALKTVRKPIALMAGNDARAIAILQVALESGIKVPDEVAILGVDNDTLQLELLAVPLSSIRLNGEKIGIEAAKLIAHQLHGKAPLRQKVTVPPLHVVERQSTDIVHCEDRDIQTVLNRMKASVGKPVSVDELTAGCGMSRAKFDRRFRAELGASPYQFLINLRFQKAEQWLLDSRQSVSNVAFACGFRQVHDFSAQFRKRYGRSPTQFRQQHLEQR